MRQDGGVTSSTQLVDITLASLDARCARRLRSVQAQHVKPICKRRIRRKPDLRRSQASCQLWPEAFVLELGVPAVDIIDLDYVPFNLYWHTKYDTIEKCSPASIAIVARVVLATLAALETDLPSRPRGASL